MFAFFPDNYAWTLACQAALGCGANINDIAHAIAPLHDGPVDPREAQDLWWSNWNDAGDRLEGVAARYREQSHWLAAQHSHRRAAAMYAFAERMLALDNPHKKATHARSIEALCASEEAAAQAGAAHRFRYLHFPYGQRELAGYLYAPKAEDGGRLPCAIALNGFDSTKEIAFLSGFAEAMAARGIAAFIIDQPGTGEALRLHGLPLEIESEHAAGAAYDFLIQDEAIDPDRVAIVGQSLGGYFAPRAAAMDARFAACVAWGGFYSMELYYQQANPDTESIPGAIEYALKAYGVETEQALIEKALKLTLAPVLDRLKVPLLCVHGANDQQTKPAHAERAVTAAVNAPDAQAHIFTQEEGAAEHCGLDNFTLVNGFMADWLAKKLI